MFKRNDKYEIFPSFLQTKKSKYPIHDSSICSLYKQPPQPPTQAKFSL